MGFAPPPRKPPSFPLPPVHQGAELDRFGLPTQVASLLGTETAQERHDRIATIEQLAADLFKSAVTHMGKKEARKLFEKVPKDYRKKGKPPHRDENNRLLSKFDELAHEHPEKSCNAIATEVAECCHEKHLSVQFTSLVSRINRLVRNRHREAMHRKAMHGGPPSLLGSEKD